MTDWLAYVGNASEVLRCFRETNQWLPITLDYLRVRPVQHPYRVQLRSGQQLTLEEHEDTIIFWLVFARRHYPVQSTDRVIVDLGANIGLFTLYAARQAPGSRILAVEPFPDTCSRLRSLVEKNQLQHRVTVIEYAVASSSAIGNMDSASEVPSQYRRIYSETTKTLNLKHRKGVEQSEDGVAVKTETLDKLLDSAQVDTADLVKVNIHGSEYDVLMSARPAVLKRCHKISVQYHEIPARYHIGKRELFGHLAGNGFALVCDKDTHRGSGLALFARVA